MRLGSRRRAQAAPRTEENGVLEIQAPGQVKGRRPVASHLISDRPGAPQWQPCKFEIARGVRRRHRAWGGERAEEVRGVSDLGACPCGSV